ncbi:hypothetical protein NQ318_005987 [Aromia moschata]|uniref:DUF5641 domain-containing protein n=1 Tax=Aromia moschata TaxID=1265417 RepID=A0AAV8XY81_9CUCU|nr:hypothetical protein NQ318_005987 [Aromia moschata]
MVDLVVENKKRGSIKAKLTNFSKFVKRIQIKESVDETDVIQLKERVKALEQAKFGFDEIQNTIEISVDDNELENQFAIRAEFEDEYFFAAGNIPEVRIDASRIATPHHINLADPTFYKPDRIDILLGSDLFWELICVGQISLGPNNPILQKTKLGWVVSGPIGIKTNSVVCKFAQTAEAESDIQKCLSKFWEIEEIQLKPTKSADEIACEEHFTANTKRDKDGRFIVSLPLKDSVQKLGDSFETAKTRFLSLERKFQTNPDFKQLYDEANWPDQPLNSEVLPDVRKGKRDIFVSIEMQESIIKRYSDLNRLKRIVAYLMRFSHNCKLKCEGRVNSSPELSLAEVDHAMMRLIQMSQAEYFHLEIESLKKGKTFNGKVVNLNPFIDSDVLVKEDNQPPMRWKLGRVEAIHAGRDGVVRVATLKTNTGFIKRSFAKICPLPVDVIPETE